MVIAKIIIILLVLNQNTINTKLLKNEDDDYEDKYLDLNYLLYFNNNNNNNNNNYFNYKNKTRLSFDNSSSSESSDFISSNEKEIDFSKYYSSDTNNKNDQNIDGNMLENLDNFYPNSSNLFTKEYSQLFTEPKNDLLRDIIRYIFIGLFFLVLCIMCILGNILVIISVFTYKPLKNVQNMFIVSLAVADLLVCVICVPFHIVTEIANGKWLFGPIVCQFFITLDILLCTASILHLCCIALDRYWAIKDSIKYAQKRTLKRVLITIVISWVVSAFVSLPGIFWNTKKNNSSSKIEVVSHNNQTSLTTTTTTVPEIDPNYICDISKDKLYRFYSSFGTFYIPLIIMTFVYYRIFLETRKRLGERAKAAKKLANSLAHSSYASNMNRKNIKAKNRALKFCPCFSCKIKKDQNDKSQTNNIEKFATVIDNKLDDLNDIDNNKNTPSTSSANKLNENKDDLDDKKLSNGQETSIKDSTRITFNLSNNIDSKNFYQSADNDDDIDEEDEDDRTDRIGKKLQKKNLINKKTKSSKYSIASSSSFTAETKTMGENNERNNDNDYKQNESELTGMKTIIKTDCDLESKKNLIDTSVTTASVGINTKKSWTHNTANTNNVLQQRQKISLTRERRAARTLGIIMGAFTICWAPFFCVYLLESFNFEFSVALVTALTWLGYVNSALNPLLYSCFNMDFRKAFKRILFDCSLCKK